MGGKVRVPRAKFCAVLAVPKPKNKGFLPLGYAHAHARRQLCLAKLARGLHSWFATRQGKPGGLAKARPRGANVCTHPRNTNPRGTGRTPKPVGRVYNRASKGAWCPNHNRASNGTVVPQRVG